MLIDWASVFFAAATEVVAGKLAEKSVNGLWELSQSLAGRHSAVDEERALLQPERLMTKAIAQLRFRNRRGALFLGPSGSGKTRLVEKLTGKKLPAGPTKSHKRVYTRLGSQVVAMRDTVGDDFQWDHYMSTVSNIASGPDVFVLVFAYGYLDTRKSPILRRPGKSKPYASLTRYTRQCREEEVDWLSRLIEKVPKLHKKRRAKAVVVVANKADQWFGNYRVPKRYNMPDGDISELVENFKRKFVLAATKTYYVETCAEHAKFRHAERKDVGLPSPKMTGEDARLSVRALRAGIEYLIANA